ATDGVDLALAAIVDRAQARTMAVGYSECEAALSEAHQAFYAALYRQAAAEGMAVIAAAGDSGAAACHAAGSEARVTSGYAVNGLASTPWNTAVGAAGFSASGMLAAWSPVNPADPAYAGGGGRSSLYRAPEWQQESDAAGKRLLPDLAIPSGIDSSLSRGLAFCQGGTGGSCTLVRAGGSGPAAALFAGLGAVLAQKYGAQGNLAPKLYALGRGNSGVFADVAEGSARLGCAAGSPGCAGSGKIGFAAAAGFDLATGLGSVNAQALVAHWTARPEIGSGAANVDLQITPDEPNNTYNPSASITLAATVLSGTGGKTPTGTVGFYDTSVTPPQALSSTPSTLSAGVASLTIEGILGVGGHNLQAKYNGDATYGTATSPSAEGQINISVSPTGTGIVPSTTTPTAGQTITVTATISVGSTPPEGSLPPSGLVTLNLAGGPIAYHYTQTLSTTGNVTTATFSFAIPSGASSFSLQAVYAGDKNYAKSTSPAVTLTLAKGATTSTVAPSTTSPYAGSSIQVTASVTATNPGASQPSGTFSVTLDSQQVGSITLTPGSPSTGTVSITIPTAGSHALGGSYSGDSNYTASTASTVTFTAQADPTTLSLAPSTTTPAPGTPVLLTATLTPQYASTATATGSVSFTLDGAPQGNGTLTSGRTATFTIPSISAGTHNVQAIYAGDTNFGASTSPSVSLNVTKITTTTVLTPATTAPIAGQSLVVSAAITASASASSLPSGTVTFTLDGTTVGTPTVTPGSPSTASVTITTLTPGSHNLAATYSGDTFYNSSIAPNVTITVGKSPTTTVITPATTTPTAGSSLQVTASVTTSNPGSTTPSGTVNFTLDGVSQQVQSVTAGTPSTATVTLPVLSAGTHSLGGTYSGDNYYATSTATPVSLTVAKGSTITTVTASPATLSPEMTETLTATVTPVNPVTGTIYTITGTVTFYDNGATVLGKAVLTSNTAAISGISLSGSINHAITAVYSGDSNWTGSTSTPLTLLAITQPDTVRLTANLSVALPGQVVVLTATVIPDSAPGATAEQNPTGNVVFYNGATIIGQAALSAVPLTYTSVATLTLATLPGGQDTIYAAYLGDLYYDAETSNLLTLTIQDFTITPDPSNPPTNLTIVKGSAGSASFIVTGEGGFNGQIQIVCAVPAQDDMTCTASPQQLTPTGTVTFVVQTFNTGNTTGANRPPSSLWPRAAGGTALAVLVFFLLPFGRRARTFAGRSGRRLVTLLLLLVGLAGAGVGCSDNTTAVTSPGTPLGVATLKITASAYVDNTVVSKSVYLTVNVVPKP
ncbi:MAG: Ig-like domain repeat protein, partial [Terracidiphilus sp.]